MKAVHRVLDPGSPSHHPKGGCALAVMTKAPLAGKVKTRLTPPLTPEEAAALNICFLRDTSAAISSVATDGQARGIGVFTPLGAESAYQEILPNSFELVPQRGEEFGERLTFAIEDLLQVGFEAVCLINSDSPTVPAECFREAIQVLRQPEDSVVLGPSDDGGYYLIGLKKPHRALFENIDWSTDRVLSQTVERARQLKIKVYLLPAWYDVDDRATLGRLCQELFGKEETEDSSSAPATRDFLAQLLQKEGRERLWPNESLKPCVP
jgi:rSAM/selenodomain-associated transferase 1